VAEERRTFTPQGGSGVTRGTRRGPLFRLLLWLGLRQDDRKTGPTAGLPPLPELIPPLAVEGVDPMASDPEALGVALQELPVDEAAGLPLLPTGALVTDPYAARTEQGAGERP